MGILDALILDGRRVDADVEDAHVGSEELWAIDQADTFTLHLDLDIAESAGVDLLNDVRWRRRTRLDLDGLVYEFVGGNKSGSSLTLTFEDADVAALRKVKGVLTVETGRLTRTQFAERLATMAAGVTFKGEPGSSKKFAVGRQRDRGEKPENNWEALQRLAEERNWRCYLHRHVVWFGSDAWLRKQHDPVTLSARTRGVVGIDFDYDIAAEEASATVTANLSRWSLPPGRPVVLERCGPADGPWLVASRSKAPYDDQVTLTLRQREPALTEAEAGRDHELLPEFDPGDLTAGAQTRFTGPVSVQVERMVRFALSKDGGPYVWGGNGPKGYDCSGLTTAAAKHVGVTIPRTSKTQFAHCRDRGRLLSVGNAVNTRGALLFRMSGDPTHVALSLGDGRTIEARGRSYGIGVFSATEGRGWTAGGLVPGVDY